MSRIPRRTPRQIITLLKRHGFLLDHATGSHYTFRHPQSGRRATVPYHNRDLPIGLLREILKQAGIPSDEL